MFDAAEVAIDSEFKELSKKDSFAKVAIKLARNHPLGATDAARALGFGHARIILRHILPNVMAPYLIILTYYIGEAILLEASLSYLGLGLHEPTPSWGLMLRGGAEEFAESAPWLAIWAGVAISLAVFGFNLVGDALRDILDPKIAHALAAHTRHGADGVFSLPPFTEGISAPRCLFHVSEINRS